jgi:uncharacterized membrane protein YjgN (DUF898 family)
MDQQSVEEVHKFQFGGSGMEYFKIWIVNLLLSVLTLGIYSAWAKVRRLQYFYRSTRLAGASFDYHGEPKAILRGRIIALILFIAYNVSFKISPMFGLVTGLLLGVVMPWLLMRSLRFKLCNSSYRGLRFNFVGNVRGAYDAFFKYPMLAGFTLYLLAPLAHQRIKQYQFSNSRYGLTDFAFSAPVSLFYGIYLLSLGVVGVAVLLAVAVFHSARPIHPVLLLGAIVMAMAVFIYVVTMFVTYMQNMTWNHTTVGGHELFSNVSTRRMLWITITNMVAIVLTLGLYKPFAVIRLLRYRLESMGLIARGDLSEFTAAQQQQVSAAGEETAEMFDVDISF